MRFFFLLLSCITTTSLTTAFSGKVVSPRLFLASPQNDDKPKLILIGGCPGTGKSTFGMSVALDQGILKCISTDTVRAVMRSFVAQDVSPALHRSSYAEAFEGDNAVRSWRETCTVLQASVESLVDDSIQRGVSLVVEGVHVVPSNELVDKWVNAGGVAMGCILQIQNQDKHKSLLRRRGFLTGNVGAEEKKIASFERIRAIQKEMMNLAKEANWLQIEQRTEPDPLDLIQNKMYHTQWGLEEHECEPPTSSTGQTLQQQDVDMINSIIEPKQQQQQHQEQPSPNDDMLLDTSTTEPTKEDITAGIPVVALDADNQEADASDVEPKLDTPTEVPPQEILDSTTTQPPQDLFSAGTIPVNNQEADNHVVNKIIGAGAAGTKPKHIFTSHDDPQQHFFTGHHHSVVKKIDFPS